MTNSTSIAAWQVSVDPLPDFGVLLSAQYARQMGESLFHCLLLFVHQQPVTEKEQFIFS